jgi:hypothetical protein
MVARMRLSPLLSTALALAAPLLASAPALAGGRGESPVVVELYTSQGCSGCFQASSYAAELAARDDVLLLSFGVDYWDYLGWKDTYAKPEFVERQRSYTGHLDNVHPYTPQMVVDGHVNRPGFDKDFINVAIGFCLQHLANSPAVSISRRDDQVAIEIGDGLPLESDADVWLVGYEPGVHETPIDAGENASRVMKTYNIVRTITRIGSYDGAPARMSAPAEDDVTYAVLVQRPDLGSMVAAETEAASGR